LAACGTGRGQVLRGDELLGLTRALLYAGTPSPLVTLWPVHQVVTRLLVEHMVGKLERPANRFDPAGSLAAAQAWLRSLTYTQASTTLAQWDGEEAGWVEQELTTLWQMTRPGETPQPASLLFAHPFFWSPYILIGDRPT
jgi:CHAT domain-containing protein